MTVLRILLIPVLVTSFIYIDDFKNARWVTVSIFIFASITDYIDGALARLWGAHTNFGRMLDPIADKMLVIATLVMMLDKGIAPVLPIVVIICREIFVSGMREYMAGMRIGIKVTIIGKIKTALQMVAIVMLIIGSEGYYINFGEVILWLAAAMTVFSGYMYFVEGMKKLEE